MLDGLRPFGPETSIVLAGDFNGTPDSPAIVRMRTSFDSAHAIRHGREPDFTYPTPLTSGDRVRSVVTRGLLRLFTNQPGCSWSGTLDYIFVSRDIEVIDCSLILDQPDETDATLYASDHFGLAATLTLPNASKMT